MTLLDEYSFDDADKLPWSNELIDFVIASKLLLRIFDKNAQDFCQKRSELQNKYRKLLSNLPEFASNLRKLISLKQAGTSREQSLDAYNNFLQLLYKATLNSVSPDNIPSFLFDFFKDPYVPDMLDGFIKYTKRYSGYLSQSMGGTLLLKKPNTKRTTGDNSLNFSIADNQVSWLFNYFRELIDLYYFNGLRCWWAPMFQFANDIIIWSDNKEYSQKESVPMTLDGVLGPIFSRKIKGTVKDQPIENTSFDHLFPEYILVASSNEDLRKAVGRIFTTDFEAILGKWGYHRNIKWKEKDFLFLFERLKLRMSVAKIAESHNCDDTTVQRNTSKLAKILFLVLPEAPHEFR